MTYGALVGGRLQWPIDLGAPALLVPSLGLHAGPTLVYVTDEVKGGVERFTQAYALSAALSYRFADTWALTLEYKLMLARGRLPEVPSSVNAGGSWFSLGFTWYLPKTGSSADRGGFNW